MKRTHDGVADAKSAFEAIGYVGWVTYGKRQGYLPCPAPRPKHVLCLPFVLVPLRPVHFGDL